MSKSGERETAGYWERRLFRNSFTYRGERRLVVGWCVKLQWKGERRTVRLRSADRRQAAQEALELFGELRRGGWSAALARRSGAGTGVATSGSGAADLPLPHIAPRKYVSDLNPGFTRELFAEVIQGGVREQLALGTEVMNEARLRAAEVQAELLAGGWSRLQLTRSREVTVAVFWQADPMTCTYTTLLSIPAASGMPGSASPRPRGWRVLVVEPDGAVRRALVHWLAACPAAGQVLGSPLATETPVEQPWDLILANRDEPPAALRRLAAGPEPSRPPTRILTHGLFADSDAIFASVSGVSRGYFLRRLPPARLLEPLVASFPDGPVRALVDEDRQIRRYFQNTFEPVEPSAELPSAEFSNREVGILDLLVRGFADKQIAGELGLSVWTVHSHLKRIFAKYGVRTRTEAVVRHLQK